MEAAAMLNNSPGDARLDILRAISRELAQPLDERGMLRAVHAELSRTLDMTMCFFGRFDAASQTVEVIWQMHEGTELPGGHFPLGDGPTSQAIRTVQPQLIRNWSRSGPAVQVQYATQRPSLPESSIVVPVVFNRQVVGVLSIQSYTPAAYDENDVRLVEAVADLLALALWRSGADRDVEAEAVLASIEDPLLVLDTAGRIVRLNAAARHLLCTRSGGLILGQPVGCAQAEQWPLGTQQISAQLQPALDRFYQGVASTNEVDLSVDGATVRCRLSVLRNKGANAGTVMLLRKTA
jgi:putative methionine-R-sulfoxide reductase with GAF domain